LQRESDGIANGDKADDKEVQDVNDADDDIVSDTGFTNRFKFSQIRMLGMDDDDLDNTVKVYKAHLAKDISKDSKGGVRTSDHIANGDHHED